MTDPSASLAKHQATTMYTGKWTKNLAREYSQWDGQPTMQCCMFGPCGDTGSGGSPVAPWATDEAEDIRGAFGDQFHQDVQTDDDLYVSTHDFGIYRHWHMVNTQQYGVKVRHAERECGGLLADGGSIWPAGHAPFTASRPSCPVVHLTLSRLLLCVSPCPLPFPSLCAGH